jgi:hypothetical protein
MGSNAWRAAVFIEMLGVTFFSIFLTPVFHVVIRWATERRKKKVTVVTT